VSWIGNLLSRRGKPQVRARYDAAQTTTLNRRHWSMADLLAADAALTPAVRERLRSRARYEAANNAYLAGMAETLATDLIGTGPKLQLDLGPDVDASAVRQVELANYDWSIAIDLPGKLRTMRKSRAIDGEVFALTTTNRALRGVQLDMRLVEGDQVTSPPITLDPTAVDGVRFDASGNVAEYHVLKFHPGAVAYGWTNEGDWVDAEDVFHWMHATRPGQHRGVGEIVPALELFAMLRRYTLAVVTAAETAADFAAVIHTNSPTSGAAAGLDEWETMPLVRGMAMALPEGWDATQMKPEQPVATFDMFVRAILNQIARAVSMPYIVAAMDSSSANYSSMRGDYLVYRKHIGCLRSDLERVVLDPLLGKWLDEAALVPGLIPDGLPPVAAWNWTWTWDGFEHVDPLKEANAEAAMVAANMTTLSEVCSKRGRDWRVVLRQRAAEKELARELGLDEPATPADATDPMETP
jgi:hypothetical protein